MNLTHFAPRTHALVAAASLALVSLVTGCAGTTENAAAATPATAQAATNGSAPAAGAAVAGPHWENRELANGIEIRIRDDASPEAREIAAQIQSEMRSRYISAR